METIAFIFGIMGFAFGLGASAQVSSLRKELAGIHPVFHFAKWQIFGPDGVKQFSETGMNRLLIGSCTHAARPAACWKRLASVLA